MERFAFRLGVVSWWCGAIWLAGGAAIAMIAIYSGSRADGGLALLAGTVLAAISWAVAFVLAGSFWKPPQQVR